MQILDLPRDVLNLILHYSIIARAYPDYTKDTPDGPHPETGFPFSRPLRLKLVCSKPPSVLDPFR
jgi:hypothetical protein